MLHLLQQEEVEEHARPQTDHPEKSVKSSKQLAGNDVVDQRVEQRSRQSRSEIQQNPRNAEHDEASAVQTQSGKQLMQFSPEPRRQSEPVESQHDKRSRERKKRYPASVRPAVTVRKIADDRSKNDVGEVRKCNDDQRVKEIRHADLFDQKRCGGTDRAVLHRPGEVAPKQPEKQHRQPRGRVNQSSGLPCFRRMQRHVCFMLLRLH